MAFVFFTNKFFCSSEKEKKPLSKKLKFLGLDFFNLYTQDTTIKFLYNSATNVYNMQLTSSPRHYQIFLNQKTSSRFIYAPFDLFSYRSKKTNYLIASLFCFKSNLNFYLFMPNKKKITFYSLSSVYPGYVWNERESKEYDSYNYRGLKDTRKLLTDYTTKNFKQNDNKYYQILQDII